MTARAASLVWMRPNIKGIFWSGICSPVHVQPYCIVQYVYPYRCVAHYPVVDRVSSIESGDLWIVEIVAAATPDTPWSQAGRNQDGPPALALCDVQANSGHVGRCNRNPLSFFSWELVINISMNMSQNSRVPNHVHPVTPDPVPVPVARTDRGLDGQKVTVQISESSWMGSQHLDDSGRIQGQLSRALCPIPQ